MRQQYALKILEELLDSSNLDLATEVRDGLECFDWYEWEKKEGAPQEEFDFLLEAGRKGSMTTSAFYRFLSMCSLKGEHHLCLTIYAASQFVSRLRYIETLEREVTND